MPAGDARISREAAQQFVQGLLALCQGNAGLMKQDGTLGTPGADGTPEGSTLPCRTDLQLLGEFNGACTDSMQLLQRRIMFDCLNEAIRDVLVCVSRNMHALLGFNIHAQGGSSTPALLASRAVQEALGRKVASWATCGAACEADFDKTIRQDVLQDKRWWDQQFAAFVPH